MFGNLGVELRIQELPSARRSSACILTLIVVNIHLLSSQSHGVIFGRRLPSLSEITMTKSLTGSAGCTKAAIVNIQLTAVKIYVSLKRLPHAPTLVRKVAFSNNLLRSLHSRIMAMSPYRVMAGDRSLSLFPISTCSFPTKNRN